MALLSTLLGHVNLEKQLGKALRTAANAYTNRSADNCRCRHGKAEAEQEVGVVGESN